MARKKKSKFWLMRMPGMEILLNFVTIFEKSLLLVKKKLSQQNLGLFSIMAAKTVKNGTFWLKFGIQRVNRMNVFYAKQTEMIKRKKNQFSIYVVNCSWLYTAF